LRRLVLEADGLRSDLARLREERDGLRDLLANPPRPHDWEDARMFFARFEAHARAVFERIGYEEVGK
jgi:hypothetical protein